MLGDVVLSTCFLHTVCVSRVCLFLDLFAAGFLGCVLFCVLRTKIVTRRFWIFFFFGCFCCFLFCFTVMRNQMLNVGFKPYTGWLLSSRADRLANEFPQYGREMVRDYAIADMEMAKE